MFECRLVFLPKGDAPRKIPFLRIETAAGIELFNLTNVLTTSCTVSAVHSPDILSRISEVHIPIKDGGYYKIFCMEQDIDELMEGISMVLHDAKESN
jgi:hypothetical protein